jgi:hypothetical protein
MSDYSDWGQPEYEEEFDLAKQAAWELEQEHLRELEEYYSEPFDDEPFDPATEVVEIIDIDEIEQEDGRTLIIQIRIFADGHEESHQFYVEPEDPNQPPASLDDIPF